MFKIISIQFNNQKPITFNDTNYIYGKNSVGKTLLFKSINFVLGHSDNPKKSFWLLNGMKNINFITCCVTNSNKSLFLQRNSKGEFFYKHNLSDTFILADRETYCKRIQEMLNTDSKYFETYTEATEEKLSYRSFTYMNFIDEYSLGWIDCIYPIASDVSQYSRIHDQMAYLFNYQTLLTIIRLREEIDQKEKSIAKAILAVEKEKYLRSLIKEQMEILNIRFSDSMLENKANFDSYLKNSAETKSNDSEDNLMFLLRVSTELENQINSARVYKNESKKYIESLEKQELLLNYFKNAILQDNDYKKYIDEISSIIEKNSIYSDFLDSKDYDKTIDSLLIKKRDIDNEILKIRNSLEKKNYVDREVAIKNLKNAFANYFSVCDANKSENQINELNKLKADLKAAEKSFKGSQNDQLNRSILLKYKKLVSKNVNFAIDDFKLPNFNLIFVPSSLSLISKYFNPKINDISRYFPGSKARFTSWQLFTCLSILEFINASFPGFPVLPILFVDGIQDPYDSNCLDSVYEVLKEESKRLNIQLFVTSTKKLSGNFQYDIDISNGLNKDFKEPLS